jgi:hypothetical protein
MGRDWRVDTLRGYFLVAMTLGHFPNPLAPFTEYTFGYASSPDGFVFLSGLVSTWVYLSVRDRRGPSTMMSKVLRRVGTIYLTHMALVVAGILFAIGGSAAGHKAASALQTLVSASLLSNQEGFDRILPMYCLFLACTPFVLRQFREGRAWLVGTISAALWIGAQFGLGDPKFAPATTTQGNFNFLAWQAFFVAGQYFGYRGLHSTHARPNQSRVLLIVCSLLALLFMVDRHLGLWGMMPLLHFSGHPDHNPARFLDAACLGYLLWSVPRAVDAAAMKLRFFQFLNFLGQHSLQVFAFSMLITRFEAHTISTFSPAFKLIAALITIASLALPAWIHQMFPGRTASRLAVATTDAVPAFRPA